MIFAIKLISFTLYPAYSRVGRGNLALKPIYAYKFVNFHLCIALVMFGKF